MPPARVLSTCTFPYSVVPAPFTTELLPAPSWEHSHRGEAKSQASHCKEEGATLGICKGLSEVKSFQGPVQPPPRWPCFCSTLGDQKSPAGRPRTVSLLFFFLMILGSPTEVYGLCLPLPHLPQVWHSFSPIVSMSNVTSGRKPILPALHTFYRIKGTKANTLQPLALGIVTNFQALFSLWQNSGCHFTFGFFFFHKALEQTLFTVRTDFHYCIMQKIFASL